MDPNFEPVDTPIQPPYRTRQNQILIGFFASLFLVTVLAAKLQTTQTKPVATKAATDINTGSVVPTLSPRQIEINDQVNQLKQLVPVNGTGFGVTYDYRRASFRVALLPDFTQSKTNFTNWIGQQSFKTLPADYFYFEASETLATPTPAPPAPTSTPILVNNYLPKGSHDKVAANSDCQVAGWTCDQDNYSTSLGVHIYNGSTFVAATSSGRTRETAVGDLCGGNTQHGFIADLKSKLSPGTYNLSAYAINIATNGSPSGSDPVLTWAGANTVQVVCPVPIVPTPTPVSTGTGTGLRGTYYQGNNFNYYTSARTDSQINFSWSGSPINGVGSDNFSVRWSGFVEAPYTGTYTFSTTSDDGVRLSINNQLIINNWTSHSSTTNTANIALTAGQKYPVTLEYFEGGGGAVIQLFWSHTYIPRQIIPQNRLYPKSIPAPVPSTGTGTGLRGTYYQGNNFNYYTSARTDSQINFSWSGSPINGVGSDNFSVRWSGFVEAPYTGTYTFSTTSDDGVRLSINNQLIINNWTSHSSTTNTANIALTAGQKYPVTLEYFEGEGGAIIELRWTIPDLLAYQLVPTSRLYPKTIPSAQPTTGTGRGLTGTYYNGTNFQTRVAARTDSQINFSWSGSPINGVGSDNFSVRWSGFVEAPYTGTYTFSTTSDDGVKLSINNQLIIDNWTSHSSTTNTANIALTAGQKYPVTLEYFEGGGGAVIQLFWVLPELVPYGITPSARLYP